MGVLSFVSNDRIHRRRSHEIRNLFDRECPLSPAIVRSYLKHALEISRLPEEQLCCTPEMLRLEGCPDEE